MPMMCMRGETDCWLDSLLEMAKGTGIGSNVGCGMPARFVEILMYTGFCCLRASAIAWSTCKQQIA